MGLDMLAFRTKDKITRPVDFTVKSGEELHYWRKHPDLHGWMECLYRAKAGRSKVFNLVNLRLFPHDLDALETVLKNGSLPRTSGFMYGESYTTDVTGDLHFVEKARQAITDGYAVFYSSWW